MYYALPSKRSCIWKKWPAMNAVKVAEKLAYVTTGGNFNMATPFVHHYLVQRWKEIDARLISVNQLLRQTSLWNYNSAGVLLDFEVSFLFTISLHTNNDLSQWGVCGYSSRQAVIYILLLWYQWLLMQSLMYLYYIIVKLSESKRPSILLRFDGSDNG